MLFVFEVTFSNSVYFSCEDIWIKIERKKTIIFATVIGLE